MKTFLTDVLSADPSHILQHVDEQKLVTLREYRKLQFSVNQPRKILSSVCWIHSSVRTDNSDIAPAPSNPIHCPNLFLHSPHHRVEDGGPGGILSSSSTASGYANGHSHFGTRATKSFSGAEKRVFS